jgi:uncharacterized membrane protein
LGGASLDIHASTPRGSSLLYWNGLLLLFVSFIPFPTGLLAEHLLQPGAKIAANLYTANLLVVSLCFRGLWLHVSRSSNPLITNGTVSNAIEAKRISNYYHLPPLLYLAAFGVSFVSKVAGVISCVLLGFFSAFRGWPIKGQ